MREFSEYVEAGLALRLQRDNNAWKWGDLTVSAVKDLDIKPGRPTDEDALTLSDLAREWDVHTARVSEWYNVAAFYPGNVRSFEGLTWTHYNMARRASEDSLQNALELLSDAVTKKLGVNAFKRYLKGEYFEGDVRYDELPPRLQALIPSSIGLVWVTVKRMDE